MENVIHVMIKIIVSNAQEINLMHVHYVLMDIILIMVCVFHAMKVVSFVQVQEIHNVNNV